MIYNQGYNQLNINILF